MNVVYENNFLSMGLEDNDTLIRIIFNTGVDYLELTEDIYKEYMNSFGDIVEKLKISKVIVDRRLSEHVITPQLQDWVGQHIAPRALSIKKLAYIVSEDIFSAVSNKQMLETKGIKNNFFPQFFNSVEKAELWVNTI